MIKLNILYGLIIGCLCCYLSSCKGNTKNFNENAGTSLVANYRQSECDVPSIQGISVRSLQIHDNVEYENRNGISVNLDCIVNGMKGSVLYFYANVFHGDGLSPVIDEQGSQVHGFECVTSVYNESQINNIGLFIPYSKLPRKYHGNLILQLAVVDGYDNILFSDAGTKIFYTTL